MKKRELVKQNTRLFGQLDASAKEVKSLKAQLKETEKQLSLVTAELKDIKSRLTEKTDEAIKTAPAETLSADSKFDEPVITEIVNGDTVKDNGFKNPETASFPQPELKEDLAYAADTIGKIVVESAKYSNELTAGGNPQYIELVNLILGKTEVSKSEILSVTREEIPVLVKKQKIEQIKNNTIEYFDSVMAQRT